MIATGVPGAAGIAAARHGGACARLRRRLDHDHGAPVSLAATRKSKYAARASQEDNTATTSQDGGASKAQDLEAQLAAAQAEAEALRSELAARKGGVVDKSFGGTVVKKKGLRDSWGFTEGEFIKADGGSAKLNKEYGIGDDGEVIGKEEADKLVQRRLLIGLALSAGAFALSQIDVPVTVAPPSKPLFVYTVPLLRLQAALTTVQEQSEYLDALGLRSQLKLAIGSISAIRDNLLSAVALLEGPNQAAARIVAFDLLGYLEQTDYNKYFEGIGVPGPYQQTEYIKFSMQSLEVAQARLAKFLSLLPREPLETAQKQFEALSEGQV